MAGGLLAQRDGMDPLHCLLAIKGPRTPRLIGPFHFWTWIWTSRTSLTQNQPLPNFKHKNADLQNIKKENSFQHNKGKEKKKRKTNNS